MLVLVIGLAVFFAIHLVPANVELRSGLVDRFGETGYKAIFAILSLIGLTLIILGFAKLQMHPGKNPQLWVPPLWCRHIAIALMLPAMIALVAAYVPSHIHTVLKHPMLVAIKMWALAHLLANGDLARSCCSAASSPSPSTTASRSSGAARSARSGPRPGPWINDAIVLVLGTALYRRHPLLAHQYFIGVSPLS